MNNLYQNRQVPGPGGETLKVFISSTMEEHRDLRATIYNSLSAIYADPFVYEKRAGARPSNVVDTSLKEVESSDILIGVFSVKYGSVTINEFQHARSLNKPCLVYIREGEQREPQLEEFLNEYVYDKKKGVSYDFFSNSVELEQKVLRDIMRLLVESYRLSTRQLPTQGIQPILKFAWDTADWFQSLGYELLGMPEQIDARAMDFKMRIKQQLVGFGPRIQHIFIRCKQGFVEIKEARDFHEAFRASGASKAMIISDVGISPDARDLLPNPDIYSLLTFDELLDSTVRFDTYLEWLENEIRSRGVPDLYILLECRKHVDEVEFMGNRDMGYWSEAKGGIDKYVNYWLQDPHKEHLSILGGFGTGKTWFIYHLAWQLLHDYREARQKGTAAPRIPLVIPLRDFAKAVTVESLFSEFFFRKHNMGLPSYEAFKQLNRMGKLILLFDGFDEMAARVDRQKMINNFWELARVLVPGGKAILTCRNEHFPEAREGRALLNAELRASVANLDYKAPQFEVVELQMFNTGQIRRLLEKRGASPDVIDNILHKPDLMDLAKRPLLAGYILDALPDIKADTPIDISRVYLYAVRLKMKNDILQERTFTSMADKLYFLCEIAWEMLSNDLPKLNYRMFPSRLRNLFGDIVFEQKDLDHWHYDMMGQTMLIRDDEGDYSMAHRSLTEFFAAYKYTAELGVMNPEFFELALHRPDIDESLPAKPYTWLGYFKRNRGKNGTLEPQAPAQRFITENPSSLEILKDMVDIEKLTPNAIVFASYMVSKEPADLEKLCNMAWEQTGLLARDVLYLIPYLKTQHADTLAVFLIQKSCGGPLINGICWLLGELGVKTGEVISALERTVTLFAEGKHSNAHAWWESGFALEKLGKFGSQDYSKGQKPIEFLSRNLPPDVSLEKSLENIYNAIDATTAEEAAVNQVDFVVIVKNRENVDIDELYARFNQLDFSTDSLGRRLYYITWLCGHLAIKKSIDNIIQATSHRQGSIRNCASEALGKINISTPGVIKALEKRLFDSYYRARFHAAEALTFLKSKGSIPALEKQIRLEEVIDLREEMKRIKTVLEKMP